MQKTLARDPFLLLYSEERPQSLIILQKQQRLAQKMFQPLRFLIIIVDDKADEENDFIKLLYQTILNEIGVQVLIKKTLNQIIEVLDSTRQTTPAILITPFNFISDVQNLKQRYKVITDIIQYVPKTKISTSCNDQIELAQQSKSNLQSSFWKSQQVYLQYQGGDLELFEDTDGIIKKIKLCITKNRVQKTHRSFLFLSDSSQKGISNILIRNIYAMINQNIGKETETKLIDELDKFVSKHYRYGIQETSFFFQLRQGLSFQQAINWYTRNSNIYRFVNNILRSTAHPAEQFYIQPYFKLLYNAVSSYYQKQTRKKTLKCYRGGKITEGQKKLFLANYGKVVKNLNFLSSSKLKHIAEKFIDNAFFEITIKKDNKENMGYASISQISQIEDEQQILFNPLNSFLIAAKPEQVNGILFIMLSYGTTELQEQHKKGECIQKVDTELKKLSQEKMISQGYALIADDCCLRGYDFYWNKCLAIIEEQLTKTQQKNSKILSLQKVLCLNNLAAYEQFIGDYKKSVLLREKSLSILRHLNYQSIEKIIDISSRLQIARSKVAYLSHCHSKTLQPYFRSKLKPSNFFYCQKQKYFKDLNNLIFAEINDKNHRSAFKLLSMVKKTYLREYRNSEPELLCIFGNHGLAFHEAGKYRQSYKILERCRRVLRMEGETTSRYLKTLGNLSMVCQSLNRFPEAIKFLQICNKTYSKFYGRSHDMYLNNLNSLSQCYYNSGEQLKAIKIKQIYLSLKIKNGMTYDYSELLHLLRMHLEIPEGLLKGFQKFLTYYAHPNLTAQEEMKVKKIKIKKILNFLMKGKQICKLKLMHKVKRMTDMISFKQLENQIHSNVISLPELQMKIRHLWKLLKIEGRIQRDIFKSKNKKFEFRKRSSLYNGLKARINRERVIHEKIQSLAYLST